MKTLLCNYRAISNRFSTNPRLFCRLAYKPVFLAFAFSLSSTIAKTQSQKLLLNADTTWTKEVFDIPLSFAPDIPYKGSEEAYFPNGWSKPDSVTFWTYIFAWKITANEPITLFELQKNICRYYDGLMQVKQNDSTKILPSTKAVFKVNTAQKAFDKLQGTIEIFDAFTLQKKLPLHAEVEQLYNSVSL